MIELTDLTKIYGGRRAVGPLTLTIPKGQFVALLGGSGCGKTTTLKMINGLIRPDGGVVTVGVRRPAMSRRTCFAAASATSSRRLASFPT